MEPSDCLQIHWGLGWKVLETETLMILNQLLEADAWRYWIVLHYNALDMIGLDQIGLDKSRLKLI